MRSASSSAFVGKRCGFFAGAAFFVGDFCATFFATTFFAGTAFFAADFFAAFFTAAPFLGARVTGTEHPLLFWLSHFSLGPPRFGTGYIINCPQAFMHIEKLFASVWRASMLTRDS